MLDPSINGVNGRGPTGRFAPGNTGGPGNPHNRRVQELRAELLDALKEGDVRDIARMLIAKAKAGDIVAAKEVLDRAVGKSHQSATMQTMAPETGELPPDELIALLQRMGVPEERWPPRILAIYRNQAMGVGMPSLPSP